MHEIRKQAREHVKARCRVCPTCNGKVCAGEVPGMGGIGTGVSFQNNITALAQHRLVMRVLHGANEPDTSCELWGRKLALPLLAAPIGSVKNNLGSDLSDAEYAKVLISGCVAANTLAGVGDTADPATYKLGLDAIEGRGRFVVPFIKPWGLDEVCERLDMAKEAGCDVCGMDVDAAGLTILRRLAAPVSTRTPVELAAIIKEAHKRNFKFIVKGIMAADEAVIAADAGADAVLVSNHGGRVLDHTPGTAEVLPAIAEAVGKRVIVMLDGGIRTGSDVLKALALGAHITLACRPVAIAAHGDPEKGVERCFAVFKEELAQAMRLTGCKTVKDVGPRVLC